jgi:hypothetical protein
MGLTLDLPQEWESELTTAATQLGLLSRVHLAAPRQVGQALKLVSPLAVVWPTATDCQRALTDFIA